MTEREIALRGVIYSLFNPIGIPHIIIYPWEISVTDDFSSRIFFLKETSADELATEFAHYPSFLCSALTELMAHGTPRKAAEIARMLNEKDPGIKKQ